MADANEGALESLYEKRLRKKLENREKEPNALEVDPVDALPVKTLDGQLYYRRGILVVISFYSLFEYILLFWPIRMII